MTERCEFHPNCKLGSCGFYTGHEHSFSPQTVSDSPYFRLVNGELGVLLSEIERSTPYALDCVDKLMNGGAVLGQRMMFEDDMELFYLKPPVTLNQTILDLKSHERVITTR